MRVEWLAQVFRGFALIAALAGSSGTALAYAPVELEAPPEPARESAESAISIDPTNDAQKGSLPDNLPTRASDGPDDGDVPESDALLDDEMDGHDTGDEAMAVPPPAASIKDVVWDPAALPAPVRATRDRLLGAAKSGNIEALRPIFAQWKTEPIVAGFETVPDAVAHLRLQSGDQEGREILAILVEVLESGHVHLGDPGAGTYVWPYFAEVPLTDLKDRHYVELYRILTAIDVEEIERQGRYTFFRVGISADGRLRYFTAGSME